jgi:predicted ATPase
MTPEEIQIENERLKHKGFKLISLQIIDSKIFGNITYDFIDENDTQDKLYTTVIIGPNGTKKSLLFNLISFIFKSIHALIHNKEIKYEEYSKYNSGSYHLKYVINNEIYSFSRYCDEGTKFSYSFTKNYKPVIEFSKEFQIPKNIVVNSTSFRDKFPFYSKEEFPNYHYLGVKNTPQTSSTQAYLKKVIDFVADLSDNSNFLYGLNLVAEEFVGDGKSFQISYKTSQHNKFFVNKSNKNEIEIYFKDMQARFDKSGKRPPNKLFNYNAIRKKDDNSINELFEYCRNIESKLKLHRDKGQSNRTIKFSLSDRNDLNNLKENIENLKKLYSIGLLTDIRLDIEDLKNGNYSLDDSSSGEHNLITSFIGYLATFTQNSLMLIDEPEISLHPNWQMKFVSFLKKLYNHEAYKTSHVIIASHSHFIVSDLEGNSSKIIGLSKLNKNIEIVSLESNLNTFGWSAEEVETNY